MNLVFDSLDFFLFGFGSRRKLLFQGGALKDARNGETVCHWDAVQQHINPFDYQVRLQTRDEREIVICEDENGVWLEEDGQRKCLTAGAPVVLPRFDNHPYSSLLRALHGDILINISEFGPVPNLLVYPRPWFRDAAMMAMVLEHTDNLHLIEEWICNLPREFDCNNFGHHEADNPGQVLYLLSLVSDANNPFVARVLKAVETLRVGDYISGLTDFNAHPVFQTKWLKFGLRALGLDDSFQIPTVFDSYSALFWMDFREHHVDGPRFSKHEAELYPYLAWAQAHFYDEQPPLHLLNSRYPLTWEGAGSEAFYAGMKRVSPQLAAMRWCAPHTWHAAEAFLSLYSQNQLSNFA